MKVHRRPGGPSEPGSPNAPSRHGSRGGPGARLALGLAAACFALSAGLITAAAVAAPAQANIAEISISKNVELKVTEPLDGVAARYVSDHTTALAELRQIAAGLGVPIPSAPSVQQLAEASQIESQSGHSLNVAFAQASVIAHEQAMVLFKQ